MKILSNICAFNVKGREYFYTNRQLECLGDLIGEINWKQWKLIYRTLEGFIWRYAIKLLTNAKVCVTYE
jgi:hypothetical protein